MTSPGQRCPDSRPPGRGLACPPPGAPSRLVNATSDPSVNLQVSVAVCPAGTETALSAPCSPRAPSSWGDGAHELRWARPWAPPLVERGSGTGRGRRGLEDVDLDRRHRQAIGPPDDVIRLGREVAQDPPQGGLQRPGSTRASAWADQRPRVGRTADPVGRGRRARPPSTPRPARPVPSRNRPARPDGRPDASPFHRQATLPMAVSPWRHSSRGDRHQHGGRVAVEGLFGLVVGIRVLRT